MNKFLCGLLATTFVGIAAASTQAHSGGPVIVSNPTIPTVSGPRPVNLCPANWHVKSGTKTASGAFTCVPNKQAEMIQCPEGTEYYDDGCLIGCEKPVF